MHTQAVDRALCPLDNRRQLVGLLAQDLRNTNPGQTLTYQQIVEQFHFNPQESAGRHILYSALKILLQEGIAFETAYKVGVTRLANSETSSYADRAISSISRKASKAIEHHRCVDYSALPERDKIRHVATGANLLMVRMAVSDNAVEAARSIASRATPVRPSIPSIVEEILADEAKRVRERQRSQSQQIPIPHLSGV